MKKLMLVIVLLTFASLYFGCNESPQNITSATQTDKVMVPFNGNINGVAITIGSSYPILKENTFSGNALHTGKYNSVLHYYITYNNIQYPTGGTILSAEGIDAILTAANGDEIWFDNSEGVWSFRSGNPTIPGMVDGTYHGDIVGGTGRFANATGYIDAILIQEYTPGVDPTPTTGTWTGQIKY